MAFFLFEFEQTGRNNWSTQYTARMHILVELFQFSLTIAIISYRVLSTKLFNHFIWATVPNFNKKLSLTFLKYLLAFPCGAFHLNRNSNSVLFKNPWLIKSEEKWARKIIYVLSRKMKWSTYSIFMSFPNSPFIWNISK